MNAPLIVHQIVASLQRRYGKATVVGKSRIFKFGSAFACSLNYSRLLGGHKYFFGLSQEVVDPDFAYPETKFGDFVLLVCGSAENVLVLPRSLVREMLSGVPTRKIDVFCEDGAYIFQTTKHPKLNVTELLNRFPKRIDPEADTTEGDATKIPRADALHTKIQWGLIQLGRAEGCSVWIPPNDRNLSYDNQSFSSQALARLPNFGFDENTRRIVQNIDALWLARNVIRKAFEIESTTQILSGLLRLNDLVLAQPNNQIELYIVAGSNRRERVQAQLLRPSFQSLISRCEFLSFEAIEGQMKKLEAFSLDRGARVSGLIQGERFTIPEHYVYPTGV
jgi:hypothetical protein